MFQNEISEYDRVVACIARYNELVAQQGVANIKKVVKEFEGDECSKKINMYKNMYLLNQSNNLAQDRVSNQIGFNNRYFSTTDKSCVDVINVK